MSFTRKALLAAGLCLIATAGLHAEEVTGIPCDALCQIGLNSDAPATTNEPQPQNAPGVMVRVRRGRASMVNDYYSLEPDCRSRGPVQILVSDMPRHGGLSVDEFAHETAIHQRRRHVCLQSEGSACDEGVL